MSIFLLFPFLWTCRYPDPPLPNSSIPIRYRQHPAHGCTAIVFTGLYILLSSFFVSMYTTDMGKVYLYTVYILYIGGWTMTYLVGWYRYFWPEFRGLFSFRFRRGWLSSSFYNIFSWMLSIIVILNSSFCTVNSIFGSTIAHKLNFVSSK